MHALSLHPLIVEPIGDEPVGVGSPLELTRRSLEESQEGGAGPAGTRFEFGMKLDAHVVRVVVEFEDFTTLTGFVFTDEHQALGLNALNEIGVDLVAMPMTLVDRFARAVESPNRRSLMLPKGGAAAQSHRAAKVGFGNFRHEHDGGVVGVVFKLRGIGTLHAQHVSAELNGGNLQAQTYSKIGHALGSSVLGCEDFPLNTSISKTTGNQNAMGVFQKPPRRLVLVGCPTVLKVARLDPVDHQFSVNGHGGVLQAFDDREIGVGEVGVLANHRDVDFFGQRVEVVGHCTPFVKEAGGGTIHSEDFAETLFLEHERDVVDVGHVVC